MKVEIDGVQYVPVAEVPADAALMRRIAEMWWGTGDAHATDPQEYRELRIRISDDGDPSDPTIEEFAAFLLRDGEP